MNKPGFVTASHTHRFGTLANWVSSTQFCIAVIAGFTVVMVVSGYGRAAAFDLAMAGVTFAIGATLRSSADLAFARRLLIASLALHWLVVGSLHVVLAVRGHAPLLTPDENGYSRFAIEQSREWLGTGPPVRAMDLYVQEPFSQLLAGAYTVGGYTPFAGLAIPVAFGTWISVAVHRLTADHFSGWGVQAARIAGVIALIYPTTLMWSCMLLKDSSLTFANLAVLLGVVGVAALLRRERARAVDLAIGAAGIAWLSTNRAAQLIPLALGTALAVIAVSLRLSLRARLVVSVVIACGVLAVPLVPAVRHKFDRLPQTLAAHRALARENARTAGPREGPSSGASWATTIEHVPDGSALVLLRPYPTEIRNFAELGGAAGNLLNLILCVVAAIGALRAWHEGRRSEILLLAGSVVSLWLLLAITEGNVGTAWRHRDVATPLLACLAAYAAAARYDLLRGLAHRRTLRRRISDPQPAP